MRKLIVLFLEIHKYFYSQLSRTWLKEHQINRPLKLTDQITLHTTLRFVPSEVTLRRVPTSKPGALFGAKLNHVIKYAFIN